MDRLGHLLLDRVEIERRVLRRLRDRVGRLGRYDSNCCLGASQRSLDIHPALNEMSIIENGAHPRGPELIFEERGVNNVRRHEASSLCGGGCTISSTISSGSRK